MVAGVKSGIGLIDYWIEDCIVWLYCHTTMMEQILAFLLAKVNVMQERADTNLERMEAEMDSNQDDMNVKQERMDPSLRKMKAEIRANKEKF
jgi:hypothetical protein